MQLDFQPGKDGKTQGIWIGISGPKGLKKPDGHTRDEQRLIIGQLAALQVEAKIAQVRERSLKQARLDALSTQANGEISKLAASTVGYFLLASAGFGITVCAPVACLAGYYLYRSLGTVGQIELAEHELANPTNPAK